MLQPYRAEFNAGFSIEKYASLCARMNERTRTDVHIRIAETPVFLPAELMAEMVTAGEELTHQLVDNPEYMRVSEEAIPERYRVPNESAKPLFMTVDFGLVHGADGLLEPKLVELQAFPSVFGYQSELAAQYRDTFGLADELTGYLGGLTEESYWNALREAIVGEYEPENVILAEITPEEQKTLPDFKVHEDHLGIRTVDIASLQKRGNRLFYLRDGLETPVHRIYNRAIVDELERKAIRLDFDYRDDLQVEWAGHPNWFYRVSKFSLPYLNHKSVPGAVFLDDWFAGKGEGKLPDDRNQWVLKPLYSFAGKGIQFAPRVEELEAIAEEERHNYLLQERVSFVPTIETPAGMTQAEIRILYLWVSGREMKPVINLVRMGRGLMMGVDHNRNQEWVGGSAGFTSLEG